MTRLSFGGTDNLGPDWASDGEIVIFVSNRGANRVRNLYWQRADGSNEAIALTSGQTPKGWPSWHPHRRVIAFSDATLDARSDIMTMPVEGSITSGFKPGQLTAFVKTPAQETNPVFSPDGNWLAYVSDESGRTEVYVRPYPGPGGKWQISTAGGSNPQWLRRPAELAYVALDRSLMAVHYSTAGAAFNADRPRTWSTKPVIVSNRGYALHPDGNRVAVETQSDMVVAPINRLTIVTAFFDELRRLSPTAQRK